MGKRGQLPLRGFRSLLFLAPPLMAWGCAAPGEPTPPHPLTPAAIGDLAAHQQGAAVVLGFTLPAKSTRGDKLTETPAVEIYRATKAPSAAGHSSFHLIATIPAATVTKELRDGRLEFSDAFDAQTGAGTELTYTVSTLLLKKRHSPDSNPAVVRVVGAPAGPENVRANVSEQAIEISWSAPSTDVFRAAIAVNLKYRVYRCERNAASATRAEDAPRCGEDGFSAAGVRGETNEARFQDTQFTFGSTYIYSVRALLETSGAPVESGDSQLLELTPKDIFPPAAPTGLIATVIPATGSEPAHVELSWEINSEADLAGYYVYRSEVQDETGQRLNSELLLAPAFRDITVVGGKKYFYRVSAVDRAGNESKVSVPAAIEMPRQ